MLATITLVFSAFIEPIAEFTLLIVLKRSCCTPVNVSFKPNSLILAA